MPAKKFVKPKPRLTKEQKQLNERAAEIIILKQEKSNLQYEMGKMCAEVEQARQATMKAEQNRDNWMNACSKRDNLLSKVFEQLEALQRTMCVHGRTESEPISIERAYGRSEGTVSQIISRFKAAMKEL